VIDPALGQPNGSLAFEAVSALIRQRRTSMLVDPHRPVPADVLHHLCELAQWAPNHKRTWPWRFSVFVESGRARLGEALVADTRERGPCDDQIAEKLVAKYQRTPAVLVVGAATADLPVRRLENRDAVAAGVQNILLGASALGLASYWASPPAGAGRRTLELCGFEPETRIVAIVYLGWAAGSPAAPTRPSVALKVVDR